MFPRRLVRKKNGKPLTYWALAESCRTARGSRQRIVAYLGELGGEEPNGWTQLCSHPNGEAERRRPQLSPFDPPAATARQAADAPHDDEPPASESSQADKHDLPWPPPPVLERKIGNLTDIA